MRPLPLLSLLLLVTLPLGAAAPARVPAPVPANLDFEQGSPGEVPPGWFTPAALIGYTTELTTQTPKQGRQCVRVSGASQPLSSGHPSFGNVMQVVDATPYRGKHVRFRGAVRVIGQTAQAGLWMRVDRPERQMGFFDNMDDRPIVSAEWRYYEITGKIAADAETLNFGMLLKNEGTAWLDDVTIEVAGAPQVRAAPPRALTPRGLDNLIAFTRLYGVIRHFHASDQAAAADWNAVAVNGIETIEGAKNAAELATRLERLFLPLAPSLRVFPTGAPAPAKTSRPEAATAIVAWEHHGFGQNDPRSMYDSERVRHPAGEADGRFPHPSEPLALDLGGGVSASVPLAVFADETGTLPRPSLAAPPSSTTPYNGNDRSTRLGAVVILWNILQHFYPYFDVIDADWAAELKSALRAAATDRDERAFLFTLRRLVAAIDDGHGNVNHSSSGTMALLPLVWRFIGDALIVTAVEPSVSGLAPGDEVVAIDGKPPLQALRELEPLISSATPQWRRFMAEYQLAPGEPGSAAVLTVRDADGSTRQVKLTRAIRTEPVQERRPEPIAELKPGLWYVDLDRINDDDFDAALEKLAAARGIVFDLRGYPSTGTKPLLHLIDGPVQSARWNIPIVRHPDRAHLEWNTNGRWSLEPAQPRLTKNVAFLIDGRAISYAESWMGIVEAYKLAAIVGEPTAGTNGNINPTPLPGGYRVVFTGMKVLKHDGSRHHGVGIAPTVPVSPTVEGIRAGRDEQLEKAVEILENAGPSS